MRPKALQGLIENNADIDMKNIHLASLGKQLSFFSHDVRTILSSLRLNAENLQMSKTSQNVSIGLNLDRTVERCLSMLDWATSFAAKKGLAVAKQPYLLKPIIEEAFAFTQQNPLEPTVDLQIDCPNAFWVMTDNDKLFRVLYNLMFNSIRALSLSPHPRAIYVTEDEKDKHCFIELSDSATEINIPEQLIADDGTIDLTLLADHSPNKGTGLGLRIASDFMEALKGSITLRRSAAGGLLFLIAFPHEIDNQELRSRH